MSFVLSAAGLSVVIVTWAVWLKKALNQAVPNNLAGLIAGMVLGLGLACSAFAFQTSLLSSVIAAIAFVLGGFWCASAVFGGQRTGVPKIIVGQPLPAFSACNEDGSTFHSSEMDGSPYLLKFFRGHW